MISQIPHCQKCGRRNIVTYGVEPETAFKTVVLNRWREICPSCFDIEAENAGVKYTLVQLEGVAWSDRPPPRNPYKRKR